MATVSLRDVRKSDGSDTVIDGLTHDIADNVSASELLIGGERVNDTPAPRTILLRPGRRALPVRSPGT